MYRSFQPNLSKSALSRSPLRTLLLSALALGCFTLIPVARGVTPAPDGGYPGGNTAEGDGALSHLSSGQDNTAVGNSGLFFNTTGSFNTAIGAGAMDFSNTGHDNTAIGVQALSDNSTGSFNTASGVSALQGNGSGNNNTASGYQALFTNSGNDNTAAGFHSLYTNDMGTGNTATGSTALSSNTGNYNTATGLNALAFNSTGDVNTATGVNALYSNTTGINNSAEGVSALYHNVAGHDNAAAGYQALLNSKGSNNIGLGSNAGANLASGSNNIEIGNVGVAGDTGVTRIGNTTQKKTFISGISGKTVASGVGVIINSSGQLGTVLSSARFKTAIKPMDQSSEALLKLKPVTFRYKEELDPEKIPQFGLIAEEVEKVNPDLVVRDEEGKVMSVRYEAVNAMLLNEFLKEHRKVEAQEQKTHEQEATIAQLKLMAAQQQKEIATLSASVQKVSEQLELNKRAPQLVANDQ